MFRTDITQDTLPQEPKEDFPTRLQRLFALSFYLGMAPFTYGVVRKKYSSFYENHFKQSSLLWSLLGLILFFSLAAILALSLIMKYYDGWAASPLAEGLLLSFLRKALLIWLVLWAFGVWQCLMGEKRPILISIGYLAQQRWIITVGNGFLLVVLGVCFGAMCFVIRTEHLLAKDVTHAKTFLLYDDLGFIPRPFFSLAMARMVSASSKKWGPGTAILLLTTRANLDHAFQYGDFIFVGSHGTSEGLLLKDGYYRPADVPEQARHKQPLFLYFASCDSEEQRQGWINTLAPKHIKTFKGFVPTLQHLWWLWTQGPHVLKNL